MNQEPQVAIRQVVVDLGRNTLVLIVDASNEPMCVVTQEESGVIDMGTRGRLIGIELGSNYFGVAMTDGADDALTRSIDARVIVTRTTDHAIRSIEVPRRGLNYEVTFPIGNQCWRQMVNGTAIESCVRTVSRDG